MNNKDLFKTIGHIDDRLIEQADTAKRANKKNYAVLGSIAAAACITLAVGLANYSSLPAPQPAVPQISEQAPASSPTGIRKYLNYNGYRYAFVDDGAPFKFTGAEPVKSLGKLTIDLNGENGNTNESGDTQKDYAATFAAGGTLYEVPGYPSHFRIAVQYQQHYYLAEVVAKVNDSAFTAKEYLDMSNLKAQVQDIHILNHAGNDVLKKITEPASVESLIDGLYNAQTAELAGKDYEGIAEAQSQGKSYQLKFNLKDGTGTFMYIIPELNIVSMGDSYYRLPDNFIGQAGAVFKNLKQEAPPLY
ncbi:hypothetical protein [Paenibacillus sp. 1P03SA]|uniref:hypothetical protein n=1 Tax=Paenibacillus sp. 1P03SA TaxID=3132294 RepID=UPI0039A14EEC